MKDTREIAADYTDWMVKTGGFARDMTLRDYFAGLAMQADIKEYGGSYFDLVQQAYQVAEAMLEERAK